MATVIPDGRAYDEPGDEQTLDALYRAHAPRLTRHCLRLTGDRDAADDLVQEVFVRFIARFPEPPAGMHVGPYLHTMARNVLLNQRRDRHELPDDEIERSAGADDDIDVDPERAALLDEQRGQVRRCAELLTAQQQRALTLREVEGRSYAEIGSALGLGADAVAQVIARGRARLRVVLRRAQIDVGELTPECKAMLAPLSAYLDAHESGLPDVEAHLAGCARCRATLESYREAGFRFRGLAPLAPVASALARVGDVFRGGVEGPAAVAVASLAAVGVLAASGGGVMIARDLTSSGTAHGAPVTTASHLVAARAVAHDRAVVVRRPQVRGSVTLRARTSHVRAGARSAAALAPVRPRTHVVRRTTPVAAGVAPTPRTTPAAPTPTTPVVAATPTPTTTPKTSSSTPGAPAATTTVPAVAPVRDAVKKVIDTTVDVPPVSVPAVTTPALTTPAVEVPAVTVPSIATPSIATPVATVPSVTTPAIATPSVSVGSVTTPVVTTPAIRLPGVKIGPLG